MCALVGLCVLVLVLSGCQGTSPRSLTSRTSSVPGESATAAAPSPTAPSPTSTTAPAPASTFPSGAGTVSFAPRSCHALGSGPYVLPDPLCTPGATNPAVTQSNIYQTICVAGWTATVRPPESYTEPLKYEQMAAYGFSGSARYYEEDHLIPLELGGSPTSPYNLWPEPGAAPNLKDRVEDAARQAVCDGQMSLSRAQQSMATNWVTLGQALGVVQTSGGGSTPPGASPSAPISSGASSVAASCEASAAYNSAYGDWDVYVHSDQPDQVVTVSGASGPEASWHTDATGYADVYFHAPASASGEEITVVAGAATCSAQL